MKRKRTRIYLSGPITGLERETVERNFKLSEECAKKVFGSECEVVSPLDNGLPYDAPYERHMRRDISTILNCDGIVMGRGWESSYGCQAEYQVASVIGLRVLILGTDGNEPRIEANGWTISKDDKKPRIGDRVIIYFPLFSEYKVVMVTTRMLAMFDTFPFIWRPLPALPFGEDIFDKILKGDGHGRE